MKEMDGITFIKEVKKFNREAAFIMISKLSDKSLVNQAYDAGVEFFVSKPINVLEIERVCQNIIERIGIDIVAIPCNTSHYFYDEFKNFTNLKIINMIEETILS